MKASSLFTKVKPVVRSTFSQPQWESSGFYIKKKHHPELKSRISVGEKRARESKVSLLKAFIKLSGGREECCKPRRTVRLSLAFQGSCLMKFRLCTRRRPSAFCLHGKTNGKQIFSGLIRESGVLLLSVEIRSDEFYLKCIR